MARSTFQRWIEQRNLHESVKPYALPSRSERLLSEFTKQRLAVWLAGAILGLSFVSFLTTAYGLFDLLNGESSFNLRSSGLVNGVVFGIRFLIALVTTIGIQLIAVALSVFLGIQLIQLFSIGSITNNLNWTLRKLAQTMSVALLFLVISPFLTFSILFSFATFHKSLESSDEIEQKAADELRSTFDFTINTLPIMFKNQLDQMIDGLKPSPPSSFEGNSGEVVLVGGLVPSQSELGQEVQRSPSATAQVSQYQSELSEKITNFRSIIRTDDSQSQVADITRKINENEQKISTNLLVMRSADFDNEADVYRFQWEFGDTLSYSIDSNGAPQAVALPTQGRGRCRGQSVFEAWNNGDWTNGATTDVKRFYAYLLHISDRHRYPQWSPKTKYYTADDEGNTEPTQELDQLVEWRDKLKSYLLLSQPEEQISSIEGYRNDSSAMFELLELYLNSERNCDNTKGPRARTIQEAFAGRSFDFERRRSENQGLAAQNSELRSALISIESDFKEEVAIFDGVKEDLSDFLDASEVEVSTGSIVLAAERVDAIFQDKVIPQLKSLETSSCSGVVSRGDFSSPIQEETAYREAVAGDLECLEFARKNCGDLAKILRDVQNAVGDVGLQLDCSVYSVQDEVPTILDVNTFIRRVKAIGARETIDANGQQLGFDNARARAVEILRMISRERPSLDPKLASDFSKSFDSALNTIYEIKDVSTPRRSWSRMSRMLDDLWSPLNDGESDRITSPFVGERWAFGIAVTIDVMIVVLSMLVVLMYRTPVSIGAARSIPNLDEAAFDAAMKAMGREDPTVFSSVLKHTQDTGDASYPLRLLLSDVRNPELRQRARMLMALLSHETKSDRKDGDESFLLSRHAVLHLKTLADQQGVYESVDPMRTT